MQLSRSLKRDLDEKAYPGCQVLVAKDGVIIYNKSFGYFDYESRQPVTESSVYDLASASKAAELYWRSAKAYEEEIHLEQ